MLALADPVAVERSLPDGPAVPVAEVEAPARTRTRGPHRAPGATGAGNPRLSTVPTTAGIAVSGCAVARRYYPPTRRRDGPARTRSLSGSTLAVGTRVQAGGETPGRPVVRSRYEPRVSASSRRLAGVVEPHPRLRNCEPLYRGYPDAVSPKERPRWPVVGPSRRSSYRAASTRLTTLSMSHHTGPNAVAGVAVGVGVAV